MSKFDSEPDFELDEEFIRTPETDAARRNNPSRRCRALTIRGFPCRQNALIGQTLCVTHQHYRFPVCPQGPNVVIPLLEDLPTIQVVTTQVLQGILSKKLHPARAGKALYALQVAALTLPRPARLKPVDDHAPALHPVAEIFEGPDGHPLGPDEPWDDPATAGKYHVDWSQWIPLTESNACHGGGQNGCRGPSAIHCCFECRNRRLLEMAEAEAKRQHFADEEPAAVVLADLIERFREELKQAPAPESDTPAPEAEVSAPKPETLPSLEAVADHPAPRVPARRVPGANRSPLPCCQPCKHCQTPDSTRSPHRRSRGAPHICPTLADVGEHAGRPCRSTLYTVPMPALPPQPASPVTGVPSEPLSLDGVVTGVPSEPLSLDGVVTLRTSERDWLPRLTRAYRERAQVEIVDDAALGIDPATQSLLQMGLAGKLSRKEWVAATIAGGMTVFGATMVVLAVVDPDPTSKLGLLVGSGALLALTGGLQTIRILTRQRPPSIAISSKGIHIDWH